MTTYVTNGSPRSVAAAALCAVVLGSCAGDGPSSLTSPGSPSPPPPPLGTGPEMCLDGLASDFPCDGVALHRRMALNVMDGDFGNDIWGWSDGETGPEYALMGLDTGTAFVDVSNPEDPLFLGRLPTETEASFWRDIKVYRDHAFIVADGAGAHGMQVFDLARLRGSAAPATFDADVVYREFRTTRSRTRRATGSSAARRR